MSYSNIYAVHPPAFHKHLELRSISTRADKPLAAAPAKTEQGIAVIKIKGFMEKQAFWSDEVSTISVTNQVKAATAAKNVSQILLVIDSPGGSVDGITELEDAVYNARQVKPVTAQVDGMAASAAYWIASQADAIHAGRADTVGSVGVYTAIYDYSEMFKEDGVKAHLLTTGKFKGVGVPGVEITDEQIADYQGQIDEYFSLFIDAISRGRSMAQSSVKEIADGKTFMSPKAFDLGLIDGIKTYQETLAQMRTAGAAGTMAGRPNQARLDLILKAENLE